MNGHFAFNLSEYQFHVIGHAIFTTLAIRMNAANTEGLMSPPRQ